MKSSTGVTLFTNASERAKAKALAEACQEKPKKAVRERVGQNQAVAKPGAQKQATEKPAKP